MSLSPDELLERIEALELKGSAVLGFSGGSTSVARGATVYGGQGVGNFSTTKADQQWSAPRAGILSDLYVRLKTNGSSATGNTVTAHINGSDDSTLQVSYGATETGIKSDTTGRISIAKGDTITWKLLHNGSGFGDTAIVCSMISAAFT